MFDGIRHGLSNRHPDPVRSIVIDTGVLTQVFCDHLDKLDILEPAADGDLDALAFTPFHWLNSRHSSEGGLPIQGNGCRNRDVGTAVEHLMFSVRILLAALVLTFAAVQAAAPADLSAPMKSVEAIRQLRFRHPVTTVAIDRAELPERLREQVTRSMPYSPQEWEEVLEALVLVERRQADLFEGLLGLYESQVLAYYDPAARTYYSIRQPPPAMTGLPEGMNAEEGVVVHELMHALQDQHFAIGVRDRALRHDADAAMAYHALLEGEASLVMMAHLLQKSGASFEDVARSPLFDGVLASAAGAEIPVGPDTPPYFVEMLKFPYLQGLHFVVTAWRRGGWKELDRIHTDPPRSTREILHPDDYFDRRRPQTAFKVTPAAGVGRTLSVEHLGEFHWGVLVGPENALGWVNDRVTIAQDAACDTTVLAETRWDSPEAAARFRNAYTNMLESKGIGAYASTSGAQVRVSYGSDDALARRFVQ